MPKVIEEKIKKGFTTGSVATIASKAATVMLLSKKIIDECKIVLPVGENYISKINNQFIAESGKMAGCSVTKPYSDDPDVTAGIDIFVKASLCGSECLDSNESECKNRVKITGGEGIGIVTRPGLDQVIGEYAINRVPRKMIMETVLEVMNEFGYEGTVKIEISAPKGVEIAKKTFNPHMGIEGGISIIGTTGVVEPMSTKALMDTISLDIKMHYEENSERCIIVPGNYGVTFLKENYGITEKEIVLCSNYVGDSIKMAIDTGYKNIVFCSHIGKLIKVYGGIMNTHSMYGDHRMELMKKAFTKMLAKRHHAYVTSEEKTNNSKYDDLDNTQPERIAKQITNCVSTTAALDIISSMENGNEYIKEISDVIVSGACKNLIKAARTSSKYVENEIKISCIMYENSYGELAKIVSL